MAATGSEKQAAKAYYVSTPIYYVNDAPHLGHAYTTVAGDVLTRWHRQRGEKVWYLTGTDEHGQKIMRTAEANDVTPQAWADKLVEEAWKPLWEHLNIANDDFIRTTETRHTDRVQEFVQDLYDKGEIYKGGYEGPYCVGCEEYKLPGDLIDGEGDFAGQKLCPIHKKPVELLKEENYFFKLSAYGPKLLEFYAANPDFIQPESARNEVVNFVEQGLQDLSISRSTFDWGVPVPWDDQHVIYVWVDALLNYATAVGYGADQEKFDATFPADVHLIGKDILRFHSVIWPAMLMAQGLPLPGKVVANGWLMVGGEKMSKSNLTGIKPQDLTAHFGVDAYRWYFLRAIAYGSDGSFSWEDFSARYTSELAAAPWLERPQGPSREPGPRSSRRAAEPVRGAVRRAGPTDGAGTDTAVGSSVTADGATGRHAVRWRCPVPVFAGPGPAESEPGPSGWWRRCPGRDRWS
ncbi:hypothetical protein SCALM49S_08909 [Streptomyces californicus]